MNIKKLIKEKSIYIAAFMIPWLLILIHSFIRNGWPFGENIILRGDSGLQYYQICVELWNKLHNGGSLFYSWNAGGGFDFYLNFAYYLISPFTILIMIVPKAWLMDTVQTVMILKWSGIYVCYVYYFMHTKYNKIVNNRRLIAFILGSIMALSNTIIIYITFFNWNDVLMLFPILLLQIERLLDGIFEKKYYILLTLAMLCNFYMAYQVCIFLAIWFFAGIIMSKDDKREATKKISYFMINSILAALSAMIVILPCVENGFNRITIFSRDRKADYIKKILVDVFEFFGKFYIFDDISDSLSFNPNMYFSIGALIILMFYAGIKSKYKIKNLVIMVLLICGVFFGAFSYIWHGLSIPHGIYHRYIYMFFFMAAFIIMDIIQNSSELNVKNVILAIAVIDVCLIVSYLKHVNHLQNYVYLISLLLMFLYEIILFIFYHKKVSCNKIITIISVLIIVELFANSEYQLKNYNVYPIMDSYGTKDVGKLMDLTGKPNGQRTDVLNGLRNDGLLFGFNSNDIFASYINPNMIGLYTGLGMDYYDEAGYGLAGPSPVLNVLFNLNNCLGDNDKLFSDVEPAKKSGDISLYHTKHTAGLGYMVDEKISGWNTDRVEPFAIQNEFINLAANEKDVFTVEKSEVKCFDCNENIIDSVKEYEEAGFYLFGYNYGYSESGEVTVVEFPVQRDMDLYIVANNGKKAVSYAYIDDECVYQDAVSHNQQTIHIGNVKKGQVIKVEAHHEMYPEEENVMWYQFADFNEDNFEKAYAKLSNNIYDIQDFKDTYINGKIHVDKSGIMMTSIQATDGFEVYVDGEKSSYQIIGNAFIGIPLDEGDHVVEFRYSTPYLKTGLVVSIIGLLLYFFLSFPLTKLYSGGTLYKDVSTLMD